MTPLRIALLTHSTNPRGGVSHALSLGEALTDLGHTAVVLAPDPSGTGFFRPARCGTVSVPAAPVTDPGIEAMVEQRIQEYVRYFEYALTRQFDIFHAHDGIGANALADLAERGLVRGLVRTVHHLDRFDDPRLAWRQHRGVASAEAVLCVSELWRLQIREDFGIDAARVWNGVDVAEFTSAPGPADAEIRARWDLGPGPVMLSVGGCEPRKNTLRIIEAFNRFAGHHPGAKLLIVGGASVLDHSAYRKLCLDRLATLGLNRGRLGSVVCTGPVPQDAMPALYRMADALVFPSVVEGFGLAVIEAMACGTPIIASNIAPFTEYLGADDVLWVDPNDVGSIADAMARTRDAALRSKLAQSGPRLASRFDWASSARVHLGLYGGLLGSAEHRHTEPLHA